MPILPLAAYGLEGAAVTELAGGTINRAYRVDTQESSFLLKHYLSQEATPERLRANWRIQFAVAEAEFPVPSLIPALNEELAIATSDGLFTLSSFVAGTLYRPGTMPDLAAQRLGEMLGRVERCLAEAALPPPPATELATPEWIEQHLLALLEVGNKERATNQIDEHVCQLMEQKLLDIRSLTKPEAAGWAWSHGDYEWRNVMFDDEHNVAAIFDWDTADSYVAGREVLRCRSLSFLPGAPEARTFLEGYAWTSDITPARARKYVETWRYLCTYRTWPASARYLDPANYQQRWDELLSSMSYALLTGEEWEALADDFAYIARQARA